MTVKAFQRPLDWRRALIGPCLLAFVLIGAGCSQHESKGQVIATVNGQEITPQDLEAEARSSPALAQAETPVLLQRVIARTLMAQAAHSRGIDHYPGYPSDIARLKQDFIAQKLIRSSLRRPATPTPAELAKVMADNPYYFAQRQSVTVDDIGMQIPAGASASIETLKYPDDILARLTQLNIAHTRRTVILDTAKVPTGLARRLVTAPLGEVFFVRNENQLGAMSVASRVPIAAPPADATATATQIAQGAEVQQQVDTLAAQLRSQAKVVYTNGFVPPSSAGSAAAQKVAVPGKNAAH